MESDKSRVLLTRVSGALLSIERDQPEKAQRRAVQELCTAFADAEAALGALPSAHWTLREQAAALACAEARVRQKRYVAGPP